MVLSNKKLKQKLRTAKAQLLSVSDAQTPAIVNSSGTPKSEFQEFAKSILASAAQKAKLSKTKKRKRKALSLKENGENSNISDDDEDEDVSNEDEKMEGTEGSIDVEKKKKKRKIDDVGKEVKREEAKEKKKKMLKKKKKKKKKKTKTKDKEDKKEETEIRLAEETFANGNGVSENHFIQETEVAADNEASLDDGMKVYVGGIPYYSTEDDIRSYFESCGTITEIDCMKFPESGKFRGIAIISFRTEAAAKRALAIDGSDMGGLFLKIQPYKSGRAIKTSGFSPALVEGYNRIYVGNLSWDITEDDLRKVFSSCTIKSIRFGEDKETGEFRGYAHIDFSDSPSLSMALKLDQTVVSGRPVRISAAVPKKESDKKSQSTAGSTSTTPSAHKNESVKKSQSTYVITPSAPGKESDSKSQPTLDTAPADGDGLANVSGKIRRRTCYECGERGHLSSSCPKSQSTAGNTPSASINESVTKSQSTAGSTPSAPGKESDGKSQPTLETTPADADELANVSGKIRRRTCYECGERGHLSSSCPKSQSTAGNTPASINEPVSKSQSTVGSTPSASIKESLTTKSQSTAGSSASVPREEFGSKSQPTPDTTTGDGAGVANLSGKIRRRTCYECGERGHLSSSCPKKQSSDQINSVPS